MPNTRPLQHHEPPHERASGLWSTRSPLPVLKRQISADGTRKLLLQLADGQTVKTVVMTMPSSHTLCLSTQVGCPMGCTFCSTGRSGFVRNLSGAELLGQVRTAGAELHAAAGLWPERAVFMGMGEPLLNFDALRDCLHSLATAPGRHLSWRKILVSTVGIPDRLDELGPLRLALPAVSLHAPSQALRDRIMPGARPWPLRELIPALLRYPLPGRERMTIEYILIRDANDSDAHARELHELLGDMRAKINLIPCNPVPGSPHRAPEPERVGGFAAALDALGRTAFVRRSHGPDIMAACGQLRARHLADGTDRPTRETRS
jgi:23S rRNA (adenine2503-C2)-methyltransferase